ncbi:MAG: ABC transporter ATP-binding protein [Thermodesulfobacteriota bacterium]
MKAIWAKGLSKRYYFSEKETGIINSIKNLFLRKEVVIDAVKDIYLDIDIGEIIGFIGPNGAGKTTTLKMLSGILYPTAGEVKVLGFEPFRREKNFLSQITFLSGQRSYLFWDLPASEYFNFCRVIYKIPKDKFMKNFKELIQLADIGDILNIPQRKLSFGQRKRCELVAALLHDPKIIFLDEPTNALDIINARKIREFIKKKGDNGNCTIILTSHNMADIEQICSRVIIINKGRIIYDGKIENLSRSNGLNKRVKVTFNGPWNKDIIEKFGKVLNWQETEVLLEVSPERAVGMVGDLFAHFPVQDISVSDPPLEMIIEEIYRKSNVERIC